MFFLMWTAHEALPVGISRRVSLIKMILGTKNEDNSLGFGYRMEELIQESQEGAHAVRVLSLNRCCVTHERRKE